MNKYLLINLLKQGGFFMVNKILINKIGLTEASVLALLLDMNAKHGDDFFVTADTAKEILNIGRRPYDSAIASLKDCGIITTHLKGAPPKTYFVINYELLASYFEDVQNGQINLYDEDNSICANCSTNNNKYNNNPNTLSNDKDISPTQNDDFEKAWVLYGKKGNKIAAKRYWLKLTQKDKKAIMAMIPLYVSSTPDIKFRKDFSGWINPAYRRWENQIIEDSTNMKEENHVW